MEIQVFEVGPFLENTYLLSRSGKSILIDPGFATESEYKSFRSALKDELAAVVLTHAHVDHVLGLNRVMIDFKVPVYLNTTDTFLWENFGQQAQMFGLNSPGFSFQPNPLPADKEFSVSEFNFHCLFTPGHSPDHTSLYFPENKIVIAGDALFKESIGRTDLYKGDFKVLEQSIREKLYTLPDETVVYPGHGPSTTIGYEKKNNGFVKG